MPVVLQVFPPSVETKIWWPLPSPSTVFELMKTWSARPPASQGRAPARADTGPLSPGRVRAHEDLVGETPREPGPVAVVAEPGSLVPGLPAVDRRKDGVVGKVDARVVDEIGRASCRERV